MLASPQAVSVLKVRKLFRNNLTLNQRGQRKLHKITKLYWNTESDVWFNPLRPEATLIFKILSLLSRNSSLPLQIINIMKASLHCTAKSGTCTSKADGGVLLGWNFECLHCKVTFRHLVLQSTTSSINSYFHTPFLKYAFKYYPPVNRITGRTWLTISDGYELVHTRWYKF
jgi:hypothetical protein